MTNSSYRSAFAADAVVPAVPRLVVDEAVARVEEHVVRALRRSVHRLEARHEEAGWQSNRKYFCLSFSLKKPLEFWLELPYSAALHRMYHRKWRALAKH